MRATISASTSDNFAVVPSTLSPGTGTLCPTISPGAVCAPTRGGSMKQPATKTPTSQVVRRPRRIVLEVVKVSFELCKIGAGVVDRRTWPKSVVLSPPRAGTSRLITDLPNLGHTPIAAGGCLARGSLDLIEPRHRLRAQDSGLTQDRSRKMSLCLSLES
jgi:hypothetical protein